MMKKVSRITIPFLFVLSVFTFLEVSVFSFRNNPGCIEVVLSAHSGEAFQHDHCKEMEISHDDFFKQSDFPDLSGIRGLSKKIHPGIVTVPLKFTHLYWHPPKLI